MFSFTLDDLLLIFKNYNLSIWPLQIVAYLLAVTAVIFSIKKVKYSSGVISAILSAFWLWTGIVFCLIHWVPSYIYAYGFAVLCIIQGILFLTFLFKPNYIESTPSPLQFKTGITILFYAMIGYPLLGFFLGHVYPNYLPLGLVPCPTAILTFGLFLCIRNKYPKYFIIIPLILAMTALVPASKGLYEDTGLFFTGFVGSYLLLKKNHI